MLLIGNGRAKSLGCSNVKAALLSSVALGGVLICGVPAKALAAAQGQTGAVEEVVVTATRVDRSGYTAPTPTTVITAQSLEQKGIANIAEALNQIPAFKASTNPTTNGIRSITPGANYADLRGLGAIRTLVLVDGQRFVPQVATALDSNQVDLNQIPAIMIERTDVVTGGASAAWGSDAVSGVVNIILKKDFTGFQAEISGGESTYGDNRSLRVAALGGLQFAGNRGHFEVAIDFAGNNGVGGPLTRPWGRLNMANIANPTPANGLPVNLIVPNSQYSTVAPGGIINNTALKGTTFGPGGVPMPFTYGSFVGASSMSGGSNVGCVNGGCGNLNISSTASVEPPTARLGTFARVGYDFSPTLRAYVNASFARTWGGGYQAAARDTAIPISINNPYLPAATKAAMQAAGITTFNLGRVSNDIGLGHPNVRNYTTRVATGFEGSVFGDWKWDASYTYGQNRYSQRVYNNRIKANFNLAAQAVINPANGQIVCADTLIRPNNGCAPLNLFGPGAPSEAAVRYVTGTTWSTVMYTQHAGAANLRGEPFRTWAGAVSVAGGLEFRQETQTTRVDPISQASGYEANNSQPLHGRFNVKEGYFETVVPLAADQAWAKSLDVNGSVRVANYSTSAGTQVTWKVGATYRAPISGLLLRATRSQDIRAPNLYELFSQPTVTTVAVNFGNLSNPLTTVFTGGNSNLRPEVAQTKTIGASYQPEFVRGLQMSVDYYDINLKNQIATITAQQGSTFCFQGQQGFCNLITFLPSGAPGTIQVQYRNLASVHIAGVDLAADYRMPVSRVFANAPGNVAAHLAWTWTLKRIVNTGIGITDRVGDVTGDPKVRGSASLTYDLKGFSLTGQARYVGAMRLDNTLIEGVTINRNHYPSALYFDFYGSYSVTDKIQLFGTLTNAFDRQPPLSMPANAVWFDEIGRTFKIGIRYKL